MSEVEQIELLQNGDHKALEVIFKEYYSPLCGFACSIHKDPDEAEETVQQVFFKLWENRENLAIHSSIKSYLFSAVRNHCLNVIKHTTVVRNHQESSFADRVSPEALAEAQASADKEYNEVNANELNQRINLAISNLPESRRKVFVMSRYEGLKYKEIAEHLEISIKTVENQMGKALKFLREELKDCLVLLLMFGSELITIFFN